MLGLDISCKHSGDDCNSKGFLCALWAQSWLMYVLKCRTRFECGEPNQPRDNLTPIHTLWTIVARGSRTRGSNVAFGSLRPFGPGSNVARGSRTLGSNVGSLTNQEIMSHLYIHFGHTLITLFLTPPAHV